MGSLYLVSVVLLLVTTTTTSTAQPFRCISPSTCTSIIDYVLPNTTTLSALRTLFGVKNHRSLLGANNLPTTTSPNQTFPANQTLRIPFPCICRNGTGVSNGQPVYTVVAGDILSHIAEVVFSRLVTYQQIQAANNIPDANLILVGQQLRIPLPCSCDQVAGERVVHYGHLVGRGNTVAGIAQMYNTTEDTLLQLNSLNSTDDLMAGAVLDVPLRACTSTVGNNSLDFPLLVPNGTYVYTATNCVRCTCNAANNWILECEPSNINSSRWSSCPSMQCEGADNLYLGNTTSSSTCNTCAYAGYNNQTILTALQSTCAVPGNGATKFSSQGWTLSLLLIAVHLVLLFLHMFQ